MRGCGHLVAACWLVACGWGMNLRGGLHAGPLYTQVAVPFIALVVLDRRAAWQWTLIVGAELAIYAGLLAAGVELTDRMPPAYGLASNLVASGLFSVLVLAMGAAMEWLREEAEAELEVAIDRRAKAEREAGMLRADRLAAIGQLVASLAHEVNNPLSYLLNNLEYLDGELTDPEHHNALADALEGATRVKAIVGDLKTFSRDDDERLVAVDLPEVIASSLRMVAGELRHRAVVRTELGPAPRVLGTRTRIGQILINLIVNAGQATDERRDNVITISLEATPTGARVSVRDTGVGIPDELLARVRDPFFTTKSIGVGTGLGLSVCENLVTKLGGVLTLVSEVGVGTVVTFTLQAASPELPVITTLPIPVVTERLRILVIDDEPAARRALERALRDHEVVTAAGGRAALTMLADDAAFDLILCDVMMPDVDGVDVAEALTTRGLDARLVLITAGAITERTRAFLAASRCPILSKPLDVATLLRQVATTPRRTART
ncbi:MAG: hybrid sensor histidine kinase/response regulator [Proteobacteria bacterium]|nr:hybrid sensor histidine kinase/response regulator [Pseudomonadota bacterium]